MSLFEQKNNLLNQVSALKSLNSGFPKLDFETSIPNFPSLNNKSNSTDFLMDLLKTLVGFEQLKEELIKFLTYNSSTIEASIKRVLLKILKSKFSCSIDALIPSFLIDGVGDGFNISINQIDFFDILKVNPKSIAGKLIYGNIDQDLNTLLYSILQGNVGTWKSLLKLEFLQSGLVDGIMTSNVLNVKIDSSWNGKTVNSFINQFISSITLFNLPILINKLFDIIFGTISSVLTEATAIIDEVTSVIPQPQLFPNIPFLGKSIGKIEAETKLEILVNKIVDLPDTEIDNSYFAFTPNDIDYFNQRVDERVNGRRILKDCNYVYSSVEFDELVDTNTALNNAPNLVEVKKTLDNRFSIMAASATSNLNPSDKNYGSLDFFEKLFKGLIQALANIIFAPKIMLLFTTYFKIVSSSIGFRDFGDFLDQNQQFIIEIIRDTLLPLIVEFLLKLVIKYVTQLILEDQLESFLEKVKQQQLQLLSLVGIPQNIRDIIARL